MVNSYSFGLVWAILRAFTPTKRPTPICESFRFWPPTRANSAVVSHGALSNLCEIVFVATVSGGNVGCWLLVARYQNRADGASLTSSRVCRDWALRRPNSLLYLGIWLFGRPNSWRLHKCLLFSMCPCARPLSLSLFLSNAIGRQLAD